MVKTVATISAASLAVVMALMTGCRIDEHKSGDDENVKIATPFGGMSVKTNEAVVESGVGLTAYPGAVLEKKEKGNDQGAADINMDVLGVHLGVKALSYRSTDAPQKVLEFYRKDMAHFGTVIDCRGSHAVGSVDHTPDGLTCDSDSGHHVKVDVEDSSKSSQEELKAGSKQHQHIVSVEPDGTGTKIGLVALDLPGKLKDSDEDKD